MTTRKSGTPFTRRNMLQRTAGAMATAAISGDAIAAARGLGQTPAPAPAAAGKPVRSDYTAQVARYMVAARTQPLSPSALMSTKHRILDSLGAMISGARLRPGETAIKFIRAQGGVPEACIVTTNILTSAINAALIHGMCAHSDETDDFEPVTKAHPGASVVPAALAMAEKESRSGADMIAAVALGYDLGCRFLMALGPDHVRGTHRSAEGLSATFGSAAAAASLARLDEAGMRYAMSYAAQQVSGLWSWVNDEDHIEKSFDFAGMGARNGVTAAVFVQAGFTGVADVLDCEHNVFQALSTQPRPAEIVAGLGSRFFVEETAIKTFSAGYPIQAPLDAFLSLHQEHQLTPGNVEHILVRLPEDGARIVDNSRMPDVNLQYVIAVALIEGRLSFKDANSRERMLDPAVLAAKSRVELVGDRALMDPAAPRSGFVEVTLRDGRKVNRFTRFPPGTKENPLDTLALNGKVRDLIGPVLGAQKAEALIQRVNTLEQVDDLRALRPLMTI